MNWNECFIYDRGTGHLIWKERPRSHFSSNGPWRHFNNRWAGRVAGKINVHYKTGVTLCRDIMIFGKFRRAHHIVWEMHNGPIPAGMDMDHINGMADDNRLENLRLATTSQNVMNARIRSDNKTGFKGVVRTRCGKFTSKVRVGGRACHLGTFTTPEEAYAAYCSAAKEHYGGFARFS